MMVSMDGEHLVVITGVHVAPGYAKTDYPLICTGQDGTPSTLEDNFHSGMYTWDTLRRNLIC